MFFAAVFVCVIVDVLFASVRVRNNTPVRARDQTPLRFGPVAGLGAHPAGWAMSPTPMDPRVTLMSRVHHRLRPQCPCSPNKLKKNILKFIHIYVKYIYLICCEQDREQDRGLAARWAVAPPMD